MNSLVKAETIGPDARENSEASNYQVETIMFDSNFLDRLVKVDIYFPFKDFPSENLSLLFVNDGQDLPKMPFLPMLSNLFRQKEIAPIVVVGIHCNEDRKLEYGTADLLDFLNRGARAKFHRKFILKELIPFIAKKNAPFSYQNISIAGFSLGGLSAMDIGWKHPEIFRRVGVFSGSFWWRKRDLNDDYDENRDRIMHELIRMGSYDGQQQYYLQTGNLDEKMDRNNNGIIDSIDDTLDLIQELKQKGADEKTHIKYVELADGKHDVPTWARAFPDFLRWGWPYKTQS